MTDGKKQGGKADPQPEGAYGQGWIGGRELVGIKGHRNRIEISKPWFRRKAHNKKVLIEVDASTRTSIGPEAIPKSATTV